MYREFFGLQENPFSVSPDPRFLFHTPETLEALACLKYGIQQRKGFILVTGEVGTGKTTLVNKFLEWLRGQRVKTAFIFNPRLNSDQFLDFMMTDFGITCDTRLKSQQLLRLNQWLLERYREGETVVLIVDEAQDLSPEVLEEVRLLTNLETSTEKLLQIVLSGQPELELELNQPQLRQLRQRITLRCRMLPLTLEQTGGYIQTRLRVAGGDGRTIFSPKAIDTVHKYARGIPRLINLLCEHALISAFAQNQTAVLASTIDEVGREFELDRIDATQLPSSPEKDWSQIKETLQGLSMLVERLRGTQ